mmetsp:Transcript_107852/g.315266  ORF Transcript_107852/g.315266 Transcript_107852/m.315266 type:complete len:430 (-) Transcript_107852:466-1755(-)
MVFHCISVFLGAKHTSSLCETDGDDSPHDAAVSACGVDQEHGENMTLGRRFSKCSSGGSTGSTAEAPSLPPSPYQGVAPMTHASLEEFMEDVASNVMPWDPDAFVHVKTLQDAVKNHTHVDHMDWLLQGAMRSVAVKRLPNTWMQTGPQEFKSQQPRAAERPWCDLGIVKYLNSISFPYACDLLGVFRDQEHTHAVTALATKGNLFAWCDLAPAPGASREAMILPIVRQAFTAISWLHRLGLAHRDISLENILLTDGCDGELQVKIIDFAMATPARKCCMEVRGKASYQAPEMHAEAEYDTFLADAFSLGVVLFAMAVQDYPWSSTRPDSCALFSYISRSGLKKFVEKRRLRPTIGNEYLVDILSPALVQLLEGILMIDPQRRLTLDDSRVDASGTGKSVWDMEWLDVSCGADTWNLHCGGDPGRLAGG